MIKIGLIGDIVGKNARNLIKTLLPQIKTEHHLDFVVANGENASHGFGLSITHAHELLGSGINVLTGGNHSFDKKEIASLLDSNTQAASNMKRLSCLSGNFQSHAAKKIDCQNQVNAQSPFEDEVIQCFQNPILRPHNCSKELAGSGVFIGTVGGERIAVLNLMGHFGMPHCDNVFLCARDEVQKLEEMGIANIIIDMHAEATSEKRALFEMLKGRVSVLCGTHTHIGTDDLMIDCGSAYVSDIGMCGALDSVIGMESDAPIKRGLSGMGNLRFEVSKSEKTILQMIICSLEKGMIKEAYKIRYIHTVGWLPRLQAIQI